VCHGNGAVRSVRGHMVFSRSCASCAGTGQQRPRACGDCAGAGYETRSDTVQVRIPAGVADGARVRVPGKGNAGRRGGPAGDLYITVHVENDPLFRREGDDIHTVVAIAVHEAALGARIEIPAPDGIARLRVPRRPDSGYASASAEPRRRGTAGGAIWWSRSGWRCPGCSTNAPRSCCASSGASTRRTPSAGPGSRPVCLGAGEKGISRWRSGRNVARPTT
jgi:hypothetical protein